MKTLHILLTLTVGLCSGHLLFAQETSDEDVDRILSEIEMEEPMGETTLVEDVMEPVDAAPADSDPMNDASIESPSDMMDDPTTVPAINLEEAESVEGLEIRGSDDTTSGLITLSYEDVKLADMVRIFAQTSGANIIIPEGMDELVSGNLNDVYWREALEVILGAKGYVLVERKSGIYTISTRSQMAIEPLSTETLDLQFITAEAALPTIKSLITSSNGSVTPIPQTNVLVLSETAERIQEIKRLVKLVDRPRRQVFIEAKFVELNDSAIQDLGINWQVLQGYTVRATGLNSEFERTDFRTAQDTQVLSTTRQRGDESTSNLDTDITLPGVDTGGTQRLSTQGIGTFEGVVQGRNFENFERVTNTYSSLPSMEQTVVKQGVLSADDFALTLSALQQLDGTRIVSNPKMLVANGQTATIHVGRNEPNIQATFVESEGGGGGNYVYSLDPQTPFLEIGVKLEVTPTISTDKNITVAIKPELSRLIGEKTVGGEVAISFPITQIRKINTEFAVESGKTVAIGGLTQSEEQEEVTKVPLLGDIPIIGKYLFTHTSTRTIQDEIIIFVTVKSMETTNLNEEEGIPEHGSLIYTWLTHQEALRTQKAENKLIKAGIMDETLQVAE